MKNWGGFLSFEPHLADFEEFFDLEENAGKKEKRSGEDTFDIVYQVLMKMV